MNPYLSVILTIAGVVLLFVLWILYENYKNKKRVLEKIRSRYGKPFAREYEPGDIELISHYFRRREEAGFVIWLWTAPIQERARNARLILSMWSPGVRPQNLSASIFQRAG